MLFCSVGDCYPCLFVGECLTVPGWATRSLAVGGEHGRFCVPHTVVCGGHGRFCPTRPVRLACPYQSVSVRNSPFAAYAGRGRCGYLPLAVIANARGRRYCRRLRLKRKCYRNAGVFSVSTTNSPVLVLTRVILSVSCTLSQPRSAFPSIKHQQAMLLLGA